MKKIILFLALFLLGLTLVAVFFVRDYLSEIEVSTVIPTKPENIAKSALWVGGPDGGVYISITKTINAKPEIYEAVIYSSSGDIDYKGELKINTTDNPLFNYAEVNSYSGWDGDTLYLQDGRTLSVVEK